VQDRLHFTAAYASVTKYPAWPHH